MQIGSDKDWSQFDLPAPPSNGDQTLFWQADVLFIILKKIRSLETGGCSSLQVLEQQILANTQSRSVFNKWWLERGVYIKLGAFFLAGLYFLVQLTDLIIGLGQ